MKLRNRITKATTWTDGDMLRWHREKRDFYRSLWACAEDSCCIIDDMFEVKLTAWASPLDTDLTVEMFEQWRDELIADGKLVPYTIAGRRYLYIPTMTEHEKPRNPQQPDWPLPPWVVCTVDGEGRNKRCTYTFRDWHGYRNATVQTDSGNRNTSPVLTCPDLTCPDLSCPDINPVSLPRVATEERGSYPQDSNPEPAIAYYEGKLERALTADELRGVKRWVRTFGTGETCVQIGYAAQDGYVDNPRRIYGALKASKTRREQVVG